MIPRPAAALAIVVTAILAPLASAPVLAQAPPAKNVLVIHLGAESFPANPLIDRGIHERLRRAPRDPHQLLRRVFRGPEPIASADPDPPFKDYLRRKFARHAYRRRHREQRSGTAIRAHLPRRAVPQGADRVLGPAGAGRRHAQRRSRHHRRPDRRQLRPDAEIRAGAATGTPSGVRRRQQSGSLVHGRSAPPPGAGSRRDADLPGGDNRPRPREGGSRGSRRYRDPLPVALAGSAGRGHLHR